MVYHKIYIYFRLIAGMYPHELYKIWWPCKWLITHYTFVCFLTYTYSCIFLHSSWLCRWFITNCTSVRLIVCVFSMSFHVLCQSWWLRKWFRTFCIFIRRINSMYTHVFCKSWRMCECFRTYGASVRFIMVLTVWMIQNTLYIYKAITCMCPHVLWQVWWLVNDLEHTVYV